MRKCHSLGSKIKQVTTGGMCAGRYWAITAFWPLRNNCCFTFLDLWPVTVHKVWLILVVTDFWCLFGSGLTLCILNIHLQEDVCHQTETLPGQRAWTGRIKHSLLLCFPAAEQRKKAILWSKLRAENSCYLLPLSSGQAILFMIFFAVSGDLSLLL